MQPPDLTVPKGDKFYDPPQSLLEGEHGELIWSRPLSGEAALDDARSNELVLYRSRDVHGKPVAVSGIIALPCQHAPKGGYPIVSWAHGTVGCADTCALLRDTAVSPAHSFNKYPHDMLNAFLNNGWAVLMTDYEGLGTEGRHPYLLGESEAHGILDIVLAVRRLYPDRLSNRLAIVGHSQGGQAALFGRTTRPSGHPISTCAVSPPWPPPRRFISSSPAAASSRSGWKASPSPRCSWPAPSAATRTSNRRSSSARPPSRCGHTSIRGPGSS